MNRQKSLTRIAELLGRFSNEVKILNSGGLYDINIHAENVLVPLINEVYNLEVVNANSTEEKNFSAVDLIDSKNKIAFQITSSADNEKVKHTLNQFIKYERYKSFDVLFIYIISEKQSSYTGKGHEEIIQDQFTFDKDEHIIDNNDLFKQINSIMSLDKINTIEQLLENEFTDAKIEFRKNKANKPESAFSEKIYPNVLELQFPETLYLANLNLDRDEIIKQSWETEYKLKKTASTRKVVSRAISFMDLPYSKDWHISENQIITFRNLYDTNETLNALIDVGTITVLKSSEYISISEDYKRIFTGLLNFCLEEMLVHKGIQNVYDENIYRFKPVRVIQTRTVKWKKTNKATRTVIFEMFDKEKALITAFRHLAFYQQLHLIDEKWFISINPTWSFTIDGYKKSGLSQYLASGLKRLENNKTIYYTFRFIAYCLNNQILEELLYPYLIVKEPQFETVTTQFDPKVILYNDELAVTDDENIIILDEH